MHNADKPLPRIRDGKTLGLYEVALERWGYEAQVGMFHEEIGEALQALNKHQRNPSVQTLIALMDELADLQVMLEQMVVAHDRDNNVWDDVYAAKVGALAKRLGVAQ